MEVVDGGLVSVPSELTFPPYIYENLGQCGVGNRAHTVAKFRCFSKNMESKFRCSAVGMR
jgi:hypothetical protein